MKVAALPCLRATFFTTYLNHISWSAQGPSRLNFIPISHWPPDATSW